MTNHPKFTESHDSAARKPGYRTSTGSRKPKFKVGEKVFCVHGCGVLTVERVEYEAAWKTTFYYLTPTDLGHQSRELRKVRGGCDD